MSKEPSKTWQPPARIEDLFSAAEGNQFSSINRPTAGARDEKQLPSGQAPIQLYSLNTPNGQKVGILLEELLETGCQADYDAFLINIGEGEQFSAGFVAVNPNSKIPACLHRNPNTGTEIRLFESGSICLYFGEFFQKFIPSKLEERAEMMNWIFWQMGSQGPFSGQFGHFFVYAPENQTETRSYGTARYGMEVQRLCDLLDQALEDRSYLVGDQYTLADIMILPWFLQMRRGYPHASGIKANEFLSIDRYKHAIRWCDRLLERPAVNRGLEVCSWSQREKGTKPWQI